ncbi:MAG: 1-(5-phosphoribosyl)-5-[(5-phosphoribosylamino)methylideneamino]imidazole-4-carboxamide isomerase [Gammaproteobacteria bacterium]|nr:1-(5-phosphoribosyl)-5-[(5-phosphoribosylamino)methylideneamino]imidazole-4-carboxamide isomerase [Gammaproteobacteria bacterium]
MLLIPAIDIKNGKCVRLRQGNMGDETVYNDDPVAMATKWVELGAKRLHIIDLDGAVSGRPVNADIIHDIAEEHPDIELQAGGGIRDEDTIQTYLDVGVNYVIIGTRAVTTPHFVSDICLEFPGHVIVGLDAKNGKLATNGWSKLSHHDVIDIAQRFEQDGVSAIIFTDIGRDGMMSSVNIDTSVELARAVTIPVIASGGVRDLDDIKALCSVAAEGIAGAITGRAIYEGNLDLKEALDLVRELCGEQNTGAG